MTRASNGLGAYGERRAVEFLINEAGMRVLDRNWRCPDGEIDIIARDGEAVVFIEVKTRRAPALGGPTAGSPTAGGPTLSGPTAGGPAPGPAFGGPAEAVGPEKVRRLRRLAAQWLAAGTVRPPEVRFDVVTVLRRPSGPALVEHLRGAF